MEIQRNSRILNYLHQSFVLDLRLYENTQRIVLMLLLSGVYNAETDETISVMEGESVILDTNLSEIHSDDTILWTFGPKGSALSQITRKNNLTSRFVTDDVRFKGRLQVDQETGSLTIRNTRNRHSGQYKLTISREKTTSRIFNVEVFGVVAETGGLKSVSVLEGESIILQNDATELQKDDLIVWRFGDKGILLAKIDVKTNKLSLNDADERFRNRLQLEQTGSLTITNARTEHSGLYVVQIRGCESLQQFLVSVSGVAGETGGLKSVPVIEGEAIILQNDATELQKDDLIVWRFGDKGILLAIIDVETYELSLNDADERFRNRLQLEQTGSLTITNARTEHSGLYEVQIRGCESTQQFLVSVSVVSDQSLTVIVGTVVAVLLVAGLIAVVVIYYYRNSELQKQVVEEEKVSVIEGRTVALNTGTKLQNGDKIKWWFQDDNPIIHKSEWTITDKDIECHVTDERFRNKVLLGGRTGDLIISYIRTIHSGVYKVQISGETRKTKRFIVTVNVKEMKVKVGKSATLETDVKIKDGDLILWTFGAKNRLIFKAEAGPTSICESFRDRLQLNVFDGSLIITNITNEDFGYFQLQVMNGERNRFRRFNVIEDSTVNKVKKLIEKDPLLLSVDEEDVQQETSSF